MQKSIKNVEYRQMRIQINVFLLILFQIIIIIIVVVRTNNLLNFETFLSTSIESLLTFFAIAFISYCQIIVVKSMFNFHSIDLLLKNSSFIYISSVSSSFIMSSTVRYMIFMLVSKFSKNLNFDEHNITKFLKSFEE